MQGVEIEPTCVTGSWRFLRCPVTSQLGLKELIEICVYQYEGKYWPREFISGNYPRRKFEE